jgi:hypothetical protein
LADGASNRLERRRVRSALLSARLFADALEDPHLRFAGIGTMPIEEALEVLAEDGRRGPGGAWTQSLTRFRVAGALKELLVAPGDVEAARMRFIDDVAAEDRPFTRGRRYRRVRSTVERLEESLGESEELRREMLGAFRESQKDAGKSSARVRGRWAALELTAATLPERDRVEQADRKQRLLGLINSGIAPTLPEDYRARLEGPLEWNPNGPTRKYEGPIKWNTQVGVEPSGATTVSSSIEFDELGEDVWHRLSHLGDPRNWSRASLFWDTSDAPEAAKQARLAEESEWSERMPGSWKAELTEVVSAVARFTAVLDVAFEVAKDETSWTAQYDLISSPDGLTRDEGFVTAVRSSDGSVRCDVLKRVDFRNGPFGGPSTLDLFTPSYLGSWVRVQQDLWAGEVMPDVVATGPASPGE